MITTKKNGRANHVPRTEILMLRLLPGELKKIEKAARLARLPTSTWVRKIALLNTSGWGSLGVGGSASVASLASAAITSASAARRRSGT